jgi:hypothetical protein
MRKGNFSSMVFAVVFVAAAGTANAEELPETPFSMVELNDSCNSIQVFLQQGNSVAEISTLQQELMIDARRACKLPLMFPDGFKDPPNGNRKDENRATHLMHELYNKWKRKDRNTNYSTLMYKIKVKKGILANEWFRQLTVGTAQKTVNGLFYESSARLRETIRIWQSQQY